MAFGQEGVFVPQLAMISESQLTEVQKKYKAHGPVGRAQNKDFTSRPKNCYLLYLSGKNTTLISELTFYWECP